MNLALVIRLPNTSTKFVTCSFSHSDLEINKYCFQRKGNTENVLHITKREKKGKDLNIKYLTFW